MRIIAIAAALGLGACTSEGKPASVRPPPPAARDAGAAARTPPTPPAFDASQPDASTPDARPPGRAIALDELPALTGATSGQVELHALDVPAGWVLMMLNPERELIVGVHSDALIGGRGRSKTPGALADALHAEFPRAFPAPVRRPKGRGPSVDLAFVAAPVRDLFRIFSDVERRNYVLGPEPATVDILVKRVPSGAVATAVAAVIGYQLEVHGSVVHARKPGGPAFDAALIARGGPLVDLSLHQARAGEVYAALAAVGADVGGAPCDGGVELDLQLRKVKAGTAAAVIAVVSGVAPSRSMACTLADAVRVKVTGLRGIVSRGKARAAIVDQDGGVALIHSAMPDGGGIGQGYVELDPRAADPRIIQLDPPPDPIDDHVPNWDRARLGFHPPRWTEQLDRGRLAATLINGKHRIALVELPDGTWHTLDQADPRLTVSIGIAVDPGQLRYTFTDDPAYPPIEHELVLRER